MKSPFDLDRMYTDFIDKENDKNYEERYRIMKVGIRLHLQDSAQGKCTMNL